jgi:hypothetical protein
MEPSLQLCNAYVHISLLLSIALEFKNVLTAILLQTSQSVVLGVDVHEGVLHAGDRGRQKDGVARDDIGVLLASKDIDTSKSNLSVTVFSSLGSGRLSNL